jgi:hypothetical protein
VQLSVDPHCRRRRRRSRATVVILSFTLRREWPMAEAFAFCLRETSCFFHDESRPILMGRENRFYVGISTLLRKGLHADPVGPKVRLSSCDKDSSHFSGLMLRHRDQSRTKESDKKECLRISFYVEPGTNSTGG